MIYAPLEGISSVEGAWALLLSGQKNIVSVPQAHALGMTPDAIRWKVKSGQWQPVYRGVYAAIQGQLPRESRLWAVILRVNENSVLSHETAAELWDFAPRVSTKIHVTV